MNKSNLSSLIKAGNKITLAVLGTLFLLVIYFTISGFNENLKTARKSILTQLQGTATAATLLINESELSYLKNKVDSDFKELDLSDSLYFNSYIILKDLQVRSGLARPLIVYTYDEGRGEFYPLLSSAENTPRSFTNEELPLALLQDYHKGGNIDLFKKESVELLAAFSPIKDADGKTVAVILVEKAFKDVRDSAFSQLTRDLLVSALVFVIIGFSLWRFISSLINREQRIRKRLIEQNEEIISQKEEIQQQSTWIIKHNKKLEEQAKTIDLQNKELKIINQMLDFKVEQRTRELEKTNAELSEFLYRSSHDIVGPVATLSGLVNVAQKDLEDQMAQEYLLRMKGTIRQLNDVIRSINIVYEIRNRELDYRNENLADLIRTTVKLHEHIAASNNVKICLDFDESIEAYVDDYLLRIALSEIVKNALIFHDINSTDRDRIAQIKVGRHKQNKLKFVIEDNGVGIDPDHISGIFEMFKKANFENEGTGLGLYLAKFAVDRLKGKIKCESKLAEGTRFELIIPVFEKIRLDR